MDGVAFFLEDLDPKAATEVRLRINGQELRIRGRFYTTEEKKALIQAGR